MAHNHLPLYLTSVLALALSQAASATERRPDDWFTSQYGPVTSCHTITGLSDGTYIFDRYLFVAGDSAEVSTGTDDMPSGFEKNSRSAGRVMLQISQKYPGRVPFVHEHYRLGESFRILNGDIFKGAVQKGSQEARRAEGWCASIEATLSPVLHEEVGGQVTTHTVAPTARLSVRGEQQELSAGDGGKVLILSEGVTPLVLVANGPASSFERVFDPLYNPLTAVHFNDKHYGHYSRDHLSFYGQTSLLSTVLTILGLSVSAANPMIGVPMAGLGLGGFLVSARMLSDFMDTPLDKANRHHKLLHSERSLVENKFDQAKLNAALNEALLESRYDLKVLSRPELKQLIQDYQQRKEPHEKEMAIARQTLSDFTGQTEELQKELQDIDDREKTLLGLQVQLNDFVTQIEEMERRLRKLNTLDYRWLPYPSKGTMIDDASSSGESPVGKSTLLAELNALTAEQSKLELQYSRLRHESMAARSRDFVKNELLKSEARLSAQIDSVASQVLQFEQDTEKPLALLEEMASTQEEIEASELRSQELKDELSTAEVHVQLMELINHYLNARRLSRHKGNTSEQTDNLIKAGWRWWNRESY